MVGIPDVSVGVLGVLVKVLGVLFGILDVFGIGVVYLLHLVFGKGYLAFSSHKKCGFLFINTKLPLQKAAHFCLLCAKNQLFNHNHHHHPYQYFHINIIVTPTSIIIIIHHHSSSSSSSSPSALPPQRSQGSLQTQRGQKHLEQKPPEMDLAQWKYSNTLIKSDELTWQKGIFLFSCVWFQDEVRCANFTLEKCVNLQRSCLATRQRKLPSKNWIMNCAKIMICMLNCESNCTLCEITRWVKHYTMCKIVNSVKSYTQSTLFHVACGKFYISLSGFLKHGN